MESFQETPVHRTRFDWANFTPKERAVLCFARRGAEVLLIQKKRGLGAGKCNGPGGKIDPPESSSAAAIRETHEEVGVVVHTVQYRGSLRFSFRDGYQLLVDVYVTDHFSGTAIETAEAIPFWCPVAAIPYEKMWEDDRLWLPQVLRDAHVDGWFQFDGERMTEARVVVGREQGGN